MRTQEKDNVEESRETYFLRKAASEIKLLKNVNEKLHIQVNTFNNMMQLFHGQSNQVNRSGYSISENIEMDIEEFLRRSEEKTDESGKVPIKEFLRKETNYEKL